jgi:hypothetical protein
MCNRTYQDSCYHSCGLFHKCNNHRLLICDVCGKRIMPGTLIIVNDQFLTCSNSHAEIIKQRNIPSGWETMTQIDYSIIGENHA